MYIKYMLHPRSLDGTSPSMEEMLREFGFSKVNTAFANALTAMNNIAAVATPSVVNLGITID